MKIRQTAFICALTFILSGETRAVDLDLARFATAKQNQIREDAQKITNRVPSIVWSFFDAVRVDDWETATNLANHIQQASGRYAYSTTNESISPALNTLIWPSISEMIGTYDQFHECTCGERNTRKMQMKEGRCKKPQTWPSGKRMHFALTRLKLFFVIPIF